MKGIYEYRIVFVSEAEVCCGSSMMFDSELKALKEVLREPDYL